MSEFWPLFGLVIRTPDLELRALREADAFALAEGLEPDLELDPTLQSYWRSHASWTVENWNLSFGVWHGDTLIGTQTLEGEQFLEKRVVDSSSYLRPEWRGKGLGKEMRRAVLTLAFGELGAEWAVSSAWADNAASLGVSRALGYELNGLSRHTSEGRASVLQHVLLTRQRWEASGGSAGITIRGFDACRPMFGLDPV
jgi:RimJ/RimL family protein N-acetyltransferase